MKKLSGIVAEYMSSIPYFLLFIVSLMPISNRGFSNSFQNEINEYIKQESLMIQSAPSLEEKLLGYLSRGDSYLMIGDYGKALSDYQEVANLTDFLPYEDRNFYSFWSLVGEAISLSNQGNYILADNYLSQVELSAQSLSWNYDSFPIPPAPPICGPEIVSPEWCEKCAQGLASSMINEYIMLVQNEAIRQRLLDIVRYLHTQAENCCKMSGFDPQRYNWRDCLGPLHQKRWLWKKKWELYKILPDPSD